MLRLYKMWVKSWSSKKLLASQEGPCSAKLVTELCIECSAFYDIVCTKDFRILFLPRRKRRIMFIITVTCSVFRAEETIMILNYLWYIAARLSSVGLKYVFRPEITNNGAWIGIHVLDGFSLHLGNNYFSSKRCTRIIDHYLNSLKNKFNSEISGVFFFGGRDINLTLPAAFD